MEPSKIVIVCALKEEFAAVAAGLGADYPGCFELIRAGVGPGAAGRVARELAARKVPPNLVVSTGYCGGLVDGLDVGDVLVGSEVCSVSIADHSPSQNCPAESVTVSHITGENSGGDHAKRVFDALQHAGARAQFGHMGSAASPVLSSADKRRFGEKFGVQAIDMESGALSAVTDATHSDPRKINLIFVRAVSDSVHDDLPSEVCEFLDENGNVRFGKIAWFVIKNPLNLRKLLGLKKRSDIAAKALIEAWKICKVALK